MTYAGIKSVAQSAVVAALVAVAVVALGIRFFVQKPRPVAVVDVAEVLRAKERQFTEALTRSDTSEAERKAIMAGATDFAKQLPGALEELTTECGGCVVLLKTAVVSKTDEISDMTPVLRQKLGLVEQ